MSCPFFISSFPFPLHLSLSLPSLHIFPFSLYPSLLSLSLHVCVSFSLLSLLSFLFFVSPSFSLISGGFLLFPSLPHADPLCLPFFFLPLDPRQLGRLRLEPLCHSLALQRRPRQDPPAIGHHSRPVCVCVSVWCWLVCVRKVKERQSVREQERKRYIDIRNQISDLRH